MKGCRKLICVDAYFLMTFLSERFLATMGNDGNNQMYPIAWEIMEGENNYSWEWFFIEL